MLGLPALVLSSPVPDRAHAPSALDASSGASLKHPLLLHQKKDEEYQIQKRPTYDSSYTCTFGPSYTGELIYYKEGYHAIGMDQSINVGMTDHDKAYVSEDFESYRGSCTCQARNVEGTGEELGAGYNSDCYFAKQTSSSTDHPMCLRRAAEGGVCQSNVVRMLSQKDEFCSSPNCYNREENEYLCKRPDFLTECSCPQRCEWVDDPDNSGIHTNLTKRMNFCQASECVGTAAKSPAGKPPNWGGACTPGADGKIPAACPCPTAFVQTHNRCLPESVMEAALQQQQAQQQQQEEEEDEEQQAHEPAPEVVGASCGCDPTQWLGYDGLTCGSCAALVNVKNHGYTCASYCADQGLACIEGWDDTSDEQCSHGATVRSCAYNYAQHTSDAICSCGCPDDDLTPSAPFDDEAPPVDSPSNDDDDYETQPDVDDGYETPPEEAAPPEVTPPASSTVTVGNDPMMKLHGGKFVKFSLSPGVLSPLLSWTSHHGDEVLRMELFGKTFSPVAMDADNNAPPPQALQTRMLGATASAGHPPTGPGRCQSGLNRTLTPAEQLSTGGGTSACCPASCGQCGGGGCEDRPGGSQACCVYGLVAANRNCRDAADVACIVPAHASFIADAKAAAAMRESEVSKADLHRLANKVGRIRNTAATRPPKLSGSAAAAKAASMVRVHEAASMVIALAVAASDAAAGDRGADGAGSEAQWFGQLTLTANGVTILSVTRGQGRFGQMRVVVEGHDPVHGGPGHEGELISQKYGLKVTLRQGQNHIGKDYRGQVLSVDAPGFSFAIESMPAKKYPDLASQIKYAHLNLKFDEAAFPSFSDGFLAQLAGVRRLDREAKAEYSVGRAHPAGDTAAGGGGGRASRRVAK